MLDPILILNNKMIFPGDLAEAVLIQGTRGSSSITVGNVGNWNSTQATKFYMLSNQINLQMTDPEIRGGVDGFVLGNTLTTTLSTMSGLRLSQLLDMYYSPWVSDFTGSTIIYFEKNIKEFNPGVV